MAISQAWSAQAIPVHGRQTHNSPLFYLINSEKRLLTNIDQTKLFSLIGGDTILIDMSNKITGSADIDGVNQRLG